MNDEDIKINGIAFADIMMAMELLQSAGLDTSSVTMSLISVMPTNTSSSSDKKD